MKPRNTFILLVLVALVGGALWQFELREGARSEGDDARTKVFADLDAAQIEWIELAQAEGPALRLEKRGEDWRLTQPIDFAADRMAADGAASALAELASESVFDPSAEDVASRPEVPESYGLTREPRVRFAAAGKTYALRLGDPTPVSGNSYVAAEGDARVFVVPQWQTGALAKTLGELRETRLFDFEREKLQRIAFAWPDGGAALEKKGDHWRLVAPLEDVADAVLVETLISDLQGLRADAFLAPASDEELGFTAPPVRIDLTAEGGASYALVLGAERAGDKRTARSGASGAVEVAASILARLPLSASALRDKTLADFAAADAQRFALTFDEPGSEPLRVTGTSSAEGWETKPAMEPGAASALLAEFASLAGREIAAESLGPAERAAFGLEPPRVRLQVFAAGGESAPVLADVRLGVLRAGSGFAAQRADRSVVYWLDESRAAGLPQSAAQFHASFAAKAAPAAAP